MSRHETWRTRKYWEKTGGLLIEEFVAVMRDVGQGKRCLGRAISNYKFQITNMCKETEGIRN